MAELIEANAWWLVLQFGIAFAGLIGYWIYVKKGPKE